MSLFYVDSSCDLDPKYIKNLGIECFDLRYKIDDQEKTITEDFDYNKFYSKVRKGVRVEFLPLSVSEYTKVFEPAMKGGDDVLYVHASSQIFDTTNLVKAKQKLINGLNIRFYNAYLELLEKMHEEKERENTVKCRRTFHK